MTIFKCHIKRKSDVPQAIEFAKELAKKYGLVDITNNRKKRYKYKYVIGVGERFWGRGRIAFATDDPTMSDNFHNDYANGLWAKHRIMSEWGRGRW